MKARYLCAGFFLFGLTYGVEGFAQSQPITFFCPPTIGLSCSDSATIPWSCQPPQYTSAFKWSILSVSGSAFPTNQVVSLSFQGAYLSSSPFGLQAVCDYKNGSNEVEIITSVSLTFYHPGNSNDSWNPYGNGTASCVSSSVTACPFVKK